MKNILNSTIRFGAITLVSFFAFTGEVFAAPALTPPTAFGISETSATLSVKMVNPINRGTTVWLEWGDTPTPTMTVGMRDVFNEGYVEGYLRGNLQPGTTYYFRGAAMDSTGTVYTPVMSFTTKGNATYTTTTTVTNNTQVNNTTSVNNTNTTSNASTNTSANSGAETTATRTVTAASAGVVKPVVKVAATTKSAPTISAMTTTQGASVIGAGDSVFPATLIGWIILLIAILIVMLMGHMLYEQIESRKKKNQYPHNLPGVGATA